jgi:hypothetical protein
MYAYIHEAGRGFFEGVCRLENQPLLFATHPHPSISLGISQQAARVTTEQVEYVVCPVRSIRYLCEVC